MSISNIDHLVARAERFENPQPEKSPRLLVHADALVANIREPEMVIHGMFERDTIASLVGSWGCGKTTVALDWLLRVTAGLAVHGRVTRSGPVIYVNGEGHAGFARRLLAWRIQNNTPLTKLPFYISNRAVPMLDDSAPSRLCDEIAELANELGAAPEVIVIDTLARNMGGDENSTGDMGRFVDAIDTYLRRPFKACVLVLHHPGHANADRGRGASAFPAAVDVEYLIKREGDLLRLNVGKPPKDFEAPAAMCWRLVPVPLMINDKPASGITVAEVGDTNIPAPSQTGLGTGQRHMLDLLRRELCRRRQHLDESGIDHRTARLSLDEWRKMGIADGAISGHRNVFYKLRDALSDRTLITIEHGFVTLPDDGIES